MERVPSAEGVTESARKVRVPRYQRRGFFCPQVGEGGGTGPRCPDSVHETMCMRQGVPVHPLDLRVFFPLSKKGGERDVSPGRAAGRLQPDFLLGG